MTIPQVKGEKFGFDGSREPEPCRDHVDVYLMTSAPRWERQRLLMRATSSLFNDGNIFWESKEFEFSSEIQLKNVWVISYNLSESQIMALHEEKKRPKFD